MANCKVIAVANQKGGVGKSTSVYCIGAGLAMDGRKVLLVDVEWTRREISQRCWASAGPTTCPTPCPSR